MKPLPRLRGLCWLLLVAWAPLCPAQIPAGSVGKIEVKHVGPQAVSDELRPLFDFSGQTCTHAAWDEDGSLHLKFSDGHEIHVHSDERRTAWELYGKRHGYAACLPHGEVRVVRHDLPEDESAER